MLTGFNIYKQAEKCHELIDLLREKKILNKFRGQEKKGIKHSYDDVFAQIEKLASLKEKGLISEEEFNQKILLREKISNVMIKMSKTNGIMFVGECFVRYRSL